MASSAKAPGAVLPQLPRGWRQPTVQPLVAATVLAIATLALPGRCAVPADLSNFQNEYPCDNTSVMIVRPVSVDDVQRSVQTYSSVQANGEGHSWNKPFFCASGQVPPAPMEPASSGRRMLAGENAPQPSANTSADGAVNVILTTIRPQTIELNKTEGTAWVSAGIKTMDLLNYLGNSVSEDAPMGWTLPAFPWFVYQSIGGAVATGTHGSSLKHNSLSDQVEALEVVLANGTLRVFTPESDPFLMKALRVSVGKLGIITRLKFRLAHEVAVQRDLRELSPPQFLQVLRSAQDAYNTGGVLPTWLDEAEAFWVTQNYKFLWVSYRRADNATDPAASQAILGALRLDNTTVLPKRGLEAGAYNASADYLAALNSSNINVPINATWVKPSGTTWQGAPWVLPVPKPANMFYGTDAANAIAAQNLRLGHLRDVMLALQCSGKRQRADDHQVGHWSMLAMGLPIGQALPLIQIMPFSSYTLLRRCPQGNATVESHEAYIKQPATTLQQLRNTLYDQYEFSVPVSTMANCWEALLEHAYGSDLVGSDTANRTVDKGFRTPPLIRFVGKEDGLLSQTHDGPRMYINIEDYLYYNTGRRTNARFKAIIGVLLGDVRCNSPDKDGPVRLHWGKAGWPDPGCFHGDEAYGINWCHFGCAVQALDPARKFKDSAPDRWMWQGVDLVKCCGSDGFISGEGCNCKVQHARNLSDCPPPPFFTNR